MDAFIDCARALAWPVAAIVIAFIIAVAYVKKTPNSTPED